jgi:hypothetical protein
MLRLHGGFHDADKFRFEMFDVYLIAQGDGELFDNALCIVLLAVETAIYKILYAMAQRSQVWMRQSPAVIRDQRWWSVTRLGLGKFRLKASSDGPSTIPKMA